jgi:hypothetical protein
VRLPLPDQLAEWSLSHDRPTLARFERLLDEKNNDSCRTSKAAQGFESLIGMIGKSTERTDACGITPGEIITLGYRRMYCRECSPNRVIERLLCLHRSEMNEQRDRMRRLSHVAMIDRNRWAISFAHDREDRKAEQDEACAD